MTRSKAVIVVSVFALFFASLAAWLTYDYLHREMTRVSSIQPQSIVVAASDIPIGSAIGQAQLRTTSWPKESIPAGSAQQVQAVVGRIAIRPIARGDAVTEQKLKPKAGTPGSGFMTYVVPQGHRAVTVAVNEVAGVAGFLTPNDRVDVVVTTPLPGLEKENVSKIILENVPILATGQVTDQKEGKPVVVPTVTLDLVPGDAEKLVLSASKGSLQLLLRNITDSDPANTRGATIAQVLSGTGRPALYLASAASAAPHAPAPRPARASAVRATVARTAQLPVHTATILDGGVRTTKEFLLQ
jgi:pilus assembly protein CpaB